MPELNSWWEKYGCDKCNKYQLLVIDLNVKPSDPKDEFKEYCNVNNVQYPAIWSGDGGRDLADAMGFGVSANSKFLVKPDRTFISGVYSGTISKEGIIEHKCDPVKIDQTCEGKRDIGVVRTGNAIQINNLNGIYKDLKIFDLQGRLIWSCKLTKESGFIAMPNEFGKGLKIVSLIGLEKIKSLSIMFEK